MRSVLDRVVDKIKTHILCSITFFFSENRAVYETRPKNVEEPQGLHDVTIWRIRVACWPSKATCARTHTHTICNISFFFTATVIRERALLLQVHWLSCF
jgi:hypothetical protein